MEPATDDIGEIFRSFLSNYPRCSDRPALIEGDATWTYGELLQISLGLEHFLSRERVGTSDLVVVIGERCATFVSLLLAVLMAGARFVVLDRAQVSRPRIDALRKLRPSHWLHLSELSIELQLLLPPNRSGFPRHKEKLQQLLEPYGRPYPHSGMTVTNPVGGHAPAYVVWTSGTASAPKLISTCHRPVTHFLRWYIGEFAFREADRFSMLSGLSHDPLLRDIFTPLSVGATLHIPTEVERVDPEALSSWMSSARVSVMHWTPSMLEALAHSTTARVFESVRLLAFGGEQLRRRHVELSRRIFPDAEIVNFYGTSETPQAMAYWRLPPKVECRDDPLPIGRGIPDVQLLVLRANQEPCSIDEEGEIYVRTSYLSEGYIGEPEETRARFVANPLTADPADRVFRTADIGKYREDGSLVLIRRADRQVKVHGHRIDLGSVELELTGLPAVSQAAAIFDSDRQRVVAYVVRRPDVAFSEAQLREHLRHHYSIHAVPAKIIVTDRLPVNRNGKLDYASLAAELTPSNKSVPLAAPTTTLTAQLRSIWETELSIATVTKTDNFCDLGGNSMVAQRISSRVHELLGLALRAEDLFVHPSIEELEVFLRNGSDFNDASLECDRTEQRRFAIASARKRQRQIDG